MKYLLATLTVVAFSAPALAQGMDFASVDADSSGSVSWEEVQAAMPDMTEDAFKTADADGSGDLSQEEFAAISG